MRVLVTGATGFIGSWVARAVLARGHEVCGTHRRGRVPPSDLQRHPRFVARLVDLDDPRAVEALAAGARTQRAIHMAWYADPATYLRSPKNMDSLALSVRLAKALYEQGCEKFVGAGSCAEYASKEALLRESDPADPQTLYGVCKVAACSAIAALSVEEKKAFAWARIFHVHGPGDAEARLVPSIVAQLRSGTVVKLTQGTQVRDHLHVADVGTAIAAIALEDASGIVNVCSGHPVTLRRVVEVVAEIVGSPELLRFGAISSRLGEVSFLAGDSTKLRQLGWAPHFTLESGLRNAVTAMTAPDAANDD